MTTTYPSTQLFIAGVWQDAADGRTLARALRVAGRVDPLFVDEIEGLPVAALKQAHGGDVLIVMGAGSIGNVAARIVELGGGVAP